MLKRLAHFIFFGNYFYGCCTVALAVEANMQQRLSLNSFAFYLLLYFGTVLFYTYAYTQEKQTNAIHTRSKWYGQHRKLVKRSEALLIILCSALFLYLVLTNIKGILQTEPLQLLLPFITVLVAMAYYGIPPGTGSVWSLRRTGWFKPFVIGFVWAVTVTYIPVVWHAAEQKITYHFSSVNVWLLLKNFMYISLLAILFDVKDYAADHNKKLKTFVVRMGLRKTIFYIIIPLTILGFISLVVFATLMHFHLVRILMNSIPFVLLLLVAWSMIQHRKSILYYLVVIDGLMLVKALCGIIAMLLVE